MFKISPIQDTATQKELLSACGAEYREGYFAYSMIDESGALMGVSQFEINGEEGYISDIKEAPGRRDFEAMFILGRATMNFIDLCGAHKCRASRDAGEESLIKSIGFKEIGEEYISDMTDMFSGHCSGETVKI